MTIERGSEIEEWQKRRDVAEERRQFREAMWELPCVRYRLPFEMADDNPAAAAEAKTMCEQECSFRIPCLEKALREETGRGKETRAGVLGGLTGAERARFARKQGCPVRNCKAPISEDDRAGVYCDRHSAARGLAS